LPENIRKHCTEFNRLSRSARTLAAQAKHNFKKGVAKWRFKPLSGLQLSDTQGPAGNVLVEHCMYSHKWFISFIKILIIANGTIREIGMDGEIGIGMGTEEMVVAATTEDGNF